MCLRLGAIDLVNSVTCKLQPTRCALVRVLDFRRARAQDGNICTWFGLYSKRDILRVVRGRGHRRIEARDHIMARIMATSCGWVGSVGSGRVEPLLPVSVCPRGNVANACPFSTNGVFGYADAVQNGPSSADLWTIPTHHDLVSAVVQNKNSPLARMRCAGAPLRGERNGRPLHAPGTRHPYFGHGCRDAKRQKRKFRS